MIIITYIFQFILVLYFTKYTALIKKFCFSILIQFIKERERKKESISDKSMSETEMVIIEINDDDDDYNDDEQEFEEYEIRESQVISLNKVSKIVSGVLCLLFLCIIACNKLFIPFKDNTFHQNLSSNIYPTMRNLVSNTNKYGWNVDMLSDWDNLDDGQKIKALNNEKEVSNFRRRYGGEKVYFRILNWESGINYVFLLNENNQVNVLKCRGQTYRMGRGPGLDNYLADQDCKNTLKGYRALTAFEQMDLDDF